MAEKTSLQVPISSLGIRIKADATYAGKLKLSTAIGQLEEGDQPAARIVLESAVSRSEEESRQLFKSLFPAGIEEIGTHGAALFMRPDSLPNDCALKIEITPSVPIVVFAEAMQIELGHIGGDEVVELTADKVTAEDLVNGPQINVEANEFRAHTVSTDLKVAALAVAITEVLEGADAEIAADTVDVTSHSGALSLKLGVVSDNPTACIKNMQGKGSSLFVDVGEGNAVVESATSGTITAAGRALGEVAVGIAEGSGSRELDSPSIAARPASDEEVLVVRDQGAQVRISVEQRPVVASTRTPHVVAGELVVPTSPRKEPPARPRR
ncbi:MAG: hypothetical protein HOQ05_06110 [Corynebacteriales bacterium]|nr:hypothetical protein [Mycobacteriales bacterium]